MNHELMRQEIKEAEEAGERALQSLYQAKDKLHSARNWGIVDLLGGGFFTNIMKHSRIRDSANCLEEAKRNLKIFQRELQDVDVSSKLGIEIHAFLSFADFFFDGLIADYLVQSKIAEAREQVEDAIVRVEYLLGELKNSY